MPREEQEQYEQDRLGNVRRKLDTLRAQEGAKEGGGPDGLVDIAAAETGSDTVVYSLPTHTNEAILVQIAAYNSAPSGNNTFDIREATLDGNGAVASSTRRSIPYEVGSATSKVFEYKGKPFENAIAVNSEFEGTFAVGVISDHHEESEPGSEQTQ